MNIPSQEPHERPPVTIRITCDKCGADLLANEHDVGKRAKCPGCGKSISITLPATAGPRKAAPVSTEPPAEKLRLKDEAIVAEPPPGAQPEETAEAKEEAAAEERLVRPAEEGHETRAKLAGWLRRVVVVAIALVAIQVFQSIYSAVAMFPPADFHSALASVFRTLAAVPANLHLLLEPRAVDPAKFPPLDRVVLGVAMFLFVVRLVLRSKLLDAIYVTTERWSERSNGGLVCHFLTLLLQVGILAWAASVVRTPGASEGLACGLLLLLLLVSAAWLMTLHLEARAEYPILTSWMFTDAAFGLVVFVVVLWPGLTLLWTRAGATGILLLANSAVTFHPGAALSIEHRQPPKWWDNPLYVGVSCVILLLVAVLLATIR